MIKILKLGAKVKPIKKVLKPESKTLKLLIKA